jgi:hypothetical protein
VANHAEGAVFSKTATGSEPGSYTVSCSGGSGSTEFLGLVLACVKNVASGVLSHTSNSGTSNTLTASGVTFSQAAVVLGLYAADGALIIVSPGSPWTTGGQIDSGSAGTTECGFSFQTFSSSSSTSTATWTVQGGGSVNWSAYQVAVG